MNIFKKYKTFDEILPSFLAGKKIEINPKSYSGYKGRTKVFSDWLKVNNQSAIPLRKISNDDFVRFFHDLIINEKKLDRPTVKKYYETICAVLNYAVDMDEMEYLPSFKGLKFPKKGKDCSAQLIPEEILAPLSNEMHDTDLQLYLAWCMEYYCGVRPRKEARLIQRGAFNLKDGVLKINAKNAKVGKTRSITMSQDLIEICKEYGMETADPNLYVFGNNRTFGEKPISENMFSYRFNKFRDKYRLSKDVKFYSGKHIGSSNLIKITDIVTVQHHLGHANITSTAHYLKRLNQGVDKNIQTNFPNPRNIGLVQKAV